MTAPAGVLDGRTVLLISPQPWDHIFISKHHYAEELARRNRVYFLEPPMPGVGARVSVRPAEGGSGVQVVSWRPSFPRTLRFHAYWLYRRLIAREARRLAGRLDHQPDVVWSFDFNLFPDLGAFGAAIRVFHPVDPLSSPRQVDIGRSADLIVSVSDPILANFSAEEFRTRTLLVNHGLGGEFADLAALGTRQAPRQAARNIGFFGNLDRKSFNLALVARLAREHGHLIYHLWGPYQDGGAVEAQLGGLPNVRMHGRRSKADLVREIDCIDCFILPYSTDEVEYDGSNSHKLLEYLSTGRPIVSRPIAAYEGHRDLICMATGESDDAFAATFSAAIGDITELSDPSLEARRKALAAEFTYGSNLRRIEQALAMRVVRTPDPEVAP